MAKRSRVHVNVLPTQWDALLKEDARGIFFVVKVRPGQKKEMLSHTSAGELVLSVAAEATEGHANERVIEIVAEIFSVAKSLVVIERGSQARIKKIHVAVDKDRVLKIITQLSTL